MRNHGVRRPGRSMAICVAMALAGGAAIAWGAWTMNALGHETDATAAAIGLGILPAIFGILFFFNFCWAYRIVGRMRRAGAPGLAVPAGGAGGTGAGLLARWTVAPATLDLFREAEARRPGRRNDWRVPRHSPPGGLDVIFSEDAVLIGDTLFGLATTGMARFDGVRRTEGSPAWLEFGTKLTWGTAQPTFRLHPSRGALRVPIAHDAGAAADLVLRHYQDVIARRTIVKPHFWRLRIRLGLGAAVIGTLAAAIGFGLRGSSLPVDLLVGMAVIGIMVALGGLVLAAAAATFRHRQHHL